MNLKKLKKAMGLGQIFGILVVAVVSAYVVKKIKDSMAKANSQYKSTNDEFDKVISDLDRETNSNSDSQSR